jgi:hypothetical protein
MKNKMLVKTAAFLLVFAGLTAAAFGQITVSGGATLYSVGSGGGIAPGGDVSLDYLLPLSIPLSLGAEIGLAAASVTGSTSGAVMAIPLLARAAYHFDLMPGLDLYAAGKIGVALGAGGSETQPGIAFGFDAGAAYYFIPVLGVFAEAGFDQVQLVGKSGYII